MKTLGALSGGGGRWGLWGQRVLQGDPGDRGPRRASGQWHGDPTGGEGAAGSEGPLTGIPEASELLPIP